MQKNASVSGTPEREKNAQGVAAYSNKMIFLRQLMPTEDKIWQKSEKNVIIGPAPRALQ
ncbi:hypothetical protein ACLK2E_09200 [Escherichia coli]